MVPRSDSSQRGEGLVYYRLRSMVSEAFSAGAKSLALKSEEKGLRIKVEGGEHETKEWFFPVRPVMVFASLRLVHGAPSVWRAGEEHKGDVEVEGNRLQLVLVSDVSFPYVGGECVKFTRA